MPDKDRMAKFRRPNRFSAPELKRFGVTILSRKHVHLQCDACRQVWSPNICPGGSLPRGYWCCPGGCNFFSAKGVSHE